VSARFVVSAEHGMHARPAARLARLLQRFEATVRLRNETTSSAWVPGGSLSRLATLAARPGQTVELEATGPQARAAVRAVLELAGRDFDDAPALGPTSPAGPSRSSAEPQPFSAGPLPASPGIGIGAALLTAAAGADGPAEVLARPGESSEPGGGGDEAGQRERLRVAVAATVEEIQAVRTRTAQELGESDAEIFDAQLVLLRDPELFSDAEARIDAGDLATTAWSKVILETAATFEDLPDPYLAARGSDVRAVGQQVLAHLLGLGSAGWPGERSGVLVAADLTPAQAATLDPSRISAVVLAYASPTGHSAILIRARGIPAVVAAGADVLSIADGTVLAVDGSCGELVVAPSEAQTAHFRERAAQAQQRERQARSQATRPARTRDGTGILVAANVGSLEDAVAAMAAGADLIGLVRTEFLFLGRVAAPDVDEQEAGYRQLAEAVAGRRLTLRTLDVGGDKPLDYLPRRSTDPEANPFLGVRGLRLALRQPDLLRTQLLAMVRVARDVPVSVMFPMVSTLDEFLTARRLLEDVIATSGPGRPSQLRVGMMVEVPAAALKAAVFAPHLDFFSIGTNDLTQYALAAERGNPALAALGDPLDPGVLHLIEATCRGAGDRPVAVCGELAAEELAAGALIGLGVRELSVGARAVPGVKQAVRELELEQTGRLAGRLLTAESATQVRELLQTAGGRRSWAAE
jgi:phosphocarrier protein FPr